MLTTWEVLIKMINHIIMSMITEVFKVPRFEVDEQVPISVQRSKFHRSALAAFNQIEHVHIAICRDNKIFLKTHLREIKRNQLRQLKVLVSSRFVP